MPEDNPEYGKTEDVQEEKPSHEFKLIPRYRWNIIDLFDFGKRALTAHVICDIDMSKVEEARKQMSEENSPVSITAFLLKAIAIAQTQHPESRTTYMRASRLMTYNKIVAGITFEKEMDEGPVVFLGEIEEPQNKTVRELQQDLDSYETAGIEQMPKFREQKDFAEMSWLTRKAIMFLATWFPSWRVRCQRATFGLSTLGSMGITMSCIRSVCTSVFAEGALEVRPVVVDDEIVIRPMLTLSLCYDQRVVDDAQAAALITCVQTILQKGLA